MLLRSTDRGLYCRAGDFHIAPWLPVERAIISHAHGDHARWGSRQYLAARDGEQVTLNDVRVSLHPAGHILGSVVRSVTEREMDASQ